MIKLCEGFWINPEHVTWLSLVGKTVHFSFAGAQSPPYYMAPGACSSVNNFASITFEFLTEQEAQAFVYRFPNTRPMSPRDFGIGCVEKQNETNNEQH